MPNPLITLKSLINKSIIIVMGSMSINNYLVIKYVKQRSTLKSTSIVINICLEKYSDQINNLHRQICYKVRDINYLPIKKYTFLIIKHTTM